MYDAEVQIVESLKGALMRSAPDTYSFLESETRGASTGLEYYGMLGAALETALEADLIPASFHGAANESISAIKRMYGG